MKNMTQVLEQAIAGLRDVVTILASHKKNLIAEGFSEKEAMQLVVALQTSLMTQGGSK